MFGEGNTRTTAVFFIKYLRTLGFDATNDIFAENAWYFRNALVRANYNDLKNGIHETTAEDLARIMRYCIMESEEREKFLEITQTKDYSFSNVAGDRTFTCHNHNAFLSMMEGALSGKTGFTSEAGYC